MRSLILHIAGSLSLVIAEDGAGGAGLPPGSNKIHEMKIEAPQITEEDQYGYNMPPQYMCNSCKAVAYHTNQVMTEKHPSTRKWKEWESEEVISQICTAKTFDGYGVKLLGGKNVLSGPALAQEEKELAGGQATIQMGGEKWAGRLASICKTMLGDDLEDEGYKLWLDGKMTEKLCHTRLEYCKNENKKFEKKVAKKKKNEEKAREKKKNVVKKVSLEEFMKKLARNQGSGEDTYIKPRIVEEWAKVLATADFSRLLSSDDSNSPGSEGGGKVEL